jgi:GT2 family glycosyltransferase
MVEVSFIIPARSLKREKNLKYFYLNISSLPELVASIRENVQISYEIIVIANGDQDVDLIKFIKENKINKYAICNLNTGVARAWNIGRQLSEGRILVYLNDDVTVGKNNVIPLVEKISSNDKVGVVGPKGAIWKNNKHEAFVGESEIAKADAIAGYAFAVKTEIFDHVGGFDVAYTPAGYEEIDFCFKCNQAGFANYVIPGLDFKTEPRHGISAKSEDIKYFNNIISTVELNERNRNLFIRKWSNKN